VAPVTVTVRSVLPSSWMSTVCGPSRSLSMNGAGRASPHTSTAALRENEVAGMYTGRR
jgi:hypothetical protein